MKVLQRKDIWLFVQRSTLTYPTDHVISAEGKRSSTIPHKGYNNKIKVEILNSYINRSTAQMYGVGEIPLNGKGMPLTHNGEGEEIVKTLYESIGCLI